MEPFLQLQFTRFLANREGEMSENGVRVSFRNHQLTVTSRKSYSDPILEICLRISV